MIFLLVTESQVLLIFFTEGNTTFWWEVEKKDQLSARLCLWPEPLSVNPVGGSVGFLGESWA